MIDIRERRDKFFELLKEYYVPDDLRKFADAINAEYNPYGYDQELKYWKMAADMAGFGITIQQLIDLKEQDVVSDYKIVRQLNTCLLSTYGSMLDKLEAEDT